MYDHSAVETTNWKQRRRVSERDSLNAETIILIICVETYNCLFHIERDLVFHFTNTHIHTNACHSFNYTIYRLRNTLSGHNVKNQSRCVFCVGYFKCSCINYFFLSTFEIEIKFVQNLNFVGIKINV